MEDLVRRLGVLEELNKAYLQRIEELERESPTPSARASNSRPTWGGVLSTQRENPRFVRDSRYAETMTSSSDLDPRSRGRSLDPPETTVHMRMRMHAGQDRTGGCSNRSNITKIIPLHSRNTNITLYYTT